MEFTEKKIRKKKYCVAWGAALKNVEVIWLVLTQKLKLVVVGDSDEKNRVYQYIRNGQYTQYKAMNYMMGQLMAGYYEGNMDIKSEEFKSAQAKLKSDHPLLAQFEFPKGLDQKSIILRKVQQDFSIALKNGLARGERNIASYRRTNPLLTNGRNVKLTHGYNSEDELKEAMSTNQWDIAVSWVNKIRFKIVFAKNPVKDMRTKDIIYNLLTSEEYKVCGSSIGIDGKKIILNLSYQMPEREEKLDDDVYFAVKFGIDTPAIGVSSKYPNTCIFFGDGENFIGQRLYLQRRIRELQRELSLTSGGHGRKAKLRPLEKYRRREKDFARTFNHQISRQIVNEARKARAKTILMEDMSEYSKEYKNTLILRNWSYYQLAQDVKYKAKQLGMNVAEVKTGLEPSECVELDYLHAILAGYKK